MQLIFIIFIYLDCKNVFSAMHMSFLNKSIFVISFRKNNYFISSLEYS